MVSEKKGKKKNKTCFELEFPIIWLNYLTIYNYFLNNLPTFLLLSIKAALKFGSFMRNNSNINIVNDNNSWKKKN